MQIGQSTFSNFGGAVSDLFAGFAAKDQGRLKAQGMMIGAAGTRLNAEGLRIKARGDLAEAANYDLAAGLARQNIAYTEQSTAIKQAQQEREQYMAIGGTRADVAGAGFAESGSALDILRSSAAQGALTHAVIGQQGMITEAGYEEQAKSYETMAAAGRMAATGEFDIANRTDTIASQTDMLAWQTQAAANKAAKGDFASALIKGVAGLAGMFLPVPVPTPAATGGMGLPAYGSMATGALY